MNITPVVKQLLIINIIFYIGTMMVGDAAYKILSLYYFESPNFEFWQPLTHMFMHGNLMHILFNMFALYSFGSALEHMWGGKKFLFFYISCGIGAAVLHTVVNYYVFHNGLNMLADSGYPANEVMPVLAEGKFNPVWQELLPGSSFQSFIGA